MNPFWKTTLEEQFGAAMYALEDALRACPDEMWSSRIVPQVPDHPNAGRFWRVAYHTLYYLDLYLSGTLEGFAPPAPFRMTASGESEALRDRAYTKQELLTYLDHCRKKCNATLDAMTEETALKLCVYPWFQFNFFELQLLTMRHVQEHAAQLNLFLGQNKIEVHDWVPRASERET